MLEKFLSFRPKFTKGRFAIKCKPKGPVYSLRIEKPHAETKREFILEESDFISAEDMAADIAEFAMLAISVKAPQYLRYLQNTISNRQNVISYLQYMI